MSDPGPVAAFGVLLVAISGLQMMRARTVAGESVAIGTFVVGAYVAWCGIGWALVRALISI